MKTINLVVGSMLLAQSVSAGSSVGNGADHIQPLFAWFTGEKPVSYCVEVASDFGVPRAFVLEQVEKAIKTWQEYIERKQINKILRPIYARRLRALEGLSPGQRAGNALPVNGYVTEFQFASSCTSDVELTFFLGVRNPRTLKEIEKRDRPFGFAHSESYSLEERRGKGFVWIVSSGAYPGGLFGSKFPTWAVDGTYSKNLHGILVHELGHVYGVGHQDHTIMANDITGPLRWGFQDVSIDQSHELLTVLSGDDTPEKFKTLLDRFNMKEYLGIDLTGMITTATLEMNEKNGKIEFENAGSHVVIKVVKKNPVLRPDRIKHFRYRYLEHDGFVVRAEDCDGLPVGDPVTLPSGKTLLTCGYKSERYWTPQDIRGGMTIHTADFILPSGDVKPGYIKENGRSYCSGAICYHRYIFMTENEHGSSFFNTMEYDFLGGIEDER